MKKASLYPLRCWAEIDLAALERNLKLIRLAMPSRIQFVAVVKADAYGHGLHQTVARLMHANADMFAVANVTEAAAIREIGSGWPILLLSALLPEEDPYVIEYDLIPTLSTTDEVERMERIARKSGRPLRVHMKIDTGMGRLGVWHEHCHGLYRRIRESALLELAGVYTHFASADTDPDFTEKQRVLFLSALASLPELDAGSLMIHADNSAGLETFSADSPFNAVRVGLLQFGILPYERSLLARVKTQPTFSFHARVSVVKSLPAGTRISYGQTRELERQSKVAVITAGYGDGVSRSCSNRAAVLIRGRRCPVLGRITMDQTIVDVTELDEVACGDRATLVGEQMDARISIEEFSEWCSTIPWEILCSVTKRVPRVYRTPLEQPD